MAKKSAGLGREFFDILSDNTFNTSDSDGVKQIRIADIEPRADQPRKDFNREALESLADSIANIGVVQPIAYWFHFSKIPRRALTARQRPA